MRGQRWMVVLWGCFLARLLFYAAMLPLWEGYDEWAHFGVVERMAGRGELLVGRQAPVARDVDASLRLAPVPWEMRTSAPPSVTEDAYWQLDAAERARRRAELRALPPAWGREDSTGGFTAYESLQPPLYYWLMTPVLWIARALGASLLAQVLTIRTISSILASLIVPMVYCIARLVLTDQRAALGCGAMVALMPGLALDVARAGNDCLAVVLFTALTWTVLDAVRNGPGIRLGVVLGLGLLTKAYFLTAIPVVFGVLAFDWRRRRRLSAAVSVSVIALLLSGWWYGRNLLTTGTLSGLSESVMLRGTGAGSMLRQAASIRWGKAVDSIFLSHLYFGGWSSLTVRSWMYHLFYIAIAAGALGVLRVLRTPAILTLASIYACFWLGQIYNVILLYMSKGLGGSMGWYMYAVVAAEVVLCVAGLRRWAPGRAKEWVAFTGAALFALLDLYTVHAVAIPYYTGMIRHRANGGLEALHGAAFQTVGIAGTVDRLSTFVPPPAIVALWLLYLAGTVAAVYGAGARKYDSVALPEG